MIVRTLREGEETALWHVFYSAVHGVAARDYSPVQLEAWAPREVDMAAWAARIASIRPFVAEAEGRILGYADVQLDGYIDHFFVAADVAGTGIGTCLMNHIHEVALGRGTANLYSEVSLTARRFFERWGFVVEAAQTVVKRGVPLENFRMHKPLPAKAESTLDVDAAVNVVPYDPDFRFRHDDLTYASVLRQP